VREQFQRARSGGFHPALKFINRNFPAIARQQQRLGEVQNEVRAEQREAGSADFPGRKTLAVDHHGKNEGDEHDEVEPVQDSQARFRTNLLLYGTITRGDGAGKEEDQNIHREGEPLDHFHLRQARKNLAIPEFHDDLR